MKASLFLSALLTATPMASWSQTSGVPEPPLVVYGKVIHIDQGSTYQVFDGAISMALENLEDPENRVVRTTNLGAAGPAFSYRIEFPQKHLPLEDELGFRLAIGAGDSTFLMTEATVNGIPAMPLDPADANIVSNFQSRGQERRIDLLVTLNPIDRDADGLPDWFEELHGLNPLFAGDASSDFDADGLSALDEFGKATDPNSSNEDPEIVSNSISIPEGGAGGLVLDIVDANSDDANLLLTAISAPSDLTFRDPGGVLGLPASFSYADILAGKIIVDAEMGATDSVVQMSVTDTTGANSPVPFQLFVSVFSPADPVGPQPALWLEPSELSGTVSEWMDKSDNARDGYQPTSAFQPSSSSAGVDFNAIDQFLYLDDTRLDLTRFDAFLSFNPTGLTTNDQSIIRIKDLELQIGGDANPLIASTLSLTRDGQIVEGPAIPFGQVTQVHLSGDMGGASMSVSGQALYRSTETSVVAPIGFSTIGASQAIQGGGASAFFGGIVHEVLLYDTPLDEAHKARVEEYQLSRWSGLVVWDARRATSPQHINGHSGTPNAITGGWGADTLAGADRADIINGGPGPDRLAGAGSGDTFKIYPEDGDDTIVDFSESDGDILDLTPIFAGSSGTPDMYLDLQVQVARPNSGAAPVANTLITMDYDGGLNDVDQSIILEGVALSNADLPRLTSSGILRLGGPRFPVEISLVAESTQLVETNSPRTLTVYRSGAVDGAFDLNISFVGDATADEDYGLSGVNGSGPIRTLSFASGELEKTITILPFQDTFSEFEEILISILPSASVSTLPNEPIRIELVDAPLVTVEILKSYAERLNATPALLSFNRTGDLSSPLDVELYISGTAVNGRDYELVSSRLTFPAQTETVELPIIPMTSSPQRDRPLVAQISVVPDISKFALLSPWTGSVAILDAIGAGAVTLDQWRAHHFPGPIPVDFANLDPDNDGATNIQEYISGTDPNAGSEFESRVLSVHGSADFVQIHVTTIAGLSDVELALQWTDKLNQPFQDIRDQFTMSYDWLTDGRIRRIYEARLDDKTIDDAGFFRVLPSLQEAPQLQVDIELALGGAGYPYLALEGPPWVLADDASQLHGPMLELGESSRFGTYVNGHCLIEFEWNADLTDRLTFAIDGSEQSFVTDTNGWIQESAQINEPGYHFLIWSVEALSAPSAHGSSSIRDISITQP